MIGHMALMKITKRRYIYFMRPISVACPISAILFMTHGQFSGFGSWGVLLIFAGINPVHFSTEVSFSCNCTLLQAGNLVVKLYNVLYFKPIANCLCMIYLNYAFLSFF